MTTSANLATTIHQLFCAGKLTEVLEYAAEDCEIVLTATGQTFRGREGFMQFMHVFKTAFPDIAITHTNVVTSGDHLVVEAIWSGTHDGPLASPNGAIPATHKRVENTPICEVMRLRNGKLVRLVNYQDMGGWLRQLGLAP